MITEDSSQDKGHSESPTLPPNTGDTDIDEILHKFAVAESLSETKLSNQLKKKTITADEYDDTLVSNYRKNKEKAKAAITKKLRAERLDELAHFKPIAEVWVEKHHSYVGVNYLNARLRELQAEETS